MEEVPYIPVKNIPVISVSLARVVEFIGPTTPCTGIKYKLINYAVKYPEDQPLKYIKYTTTSAEWVLGYYVTGKLCIGSKVATSRCDRLRFASG